MVEQNVACNKCKQPIEEEPLKHIKKCYRIFELFTPIDPKIVKFMRMNWDDFKKPLEEVEPLKVTKKQIEEKEEEEDEE